MKIAISAESTIDLTKELLEDNQIETVPFSILLGDELSYDGEVTADELINFVAENNVLPKTSAVNEFQYTEHFEKLLKDHDAVIHFSLSSKLSLACTNAINASKQFKNVYVVDTQSLSTGIALLALYAKDLTNKGVDAKGIYEKVLKRVNNVQASFVLKRLDFLYKGGRCSGIAYLGANLLKIRPQIILKDGKMQPDKKYRGDFARVVNKYCQDVLCEYDNPDLTRVFITYTTLKQEVIEQVKTLLIERGFKNVYVTRAGATITSHCGESCMGILYINDGENN